MQHARPRVYDCTYCKFQSTCSSSNLIHIHQNYGTHNQFEHLATHVFIVICNSINPLLLYHHYGNQLDYDIRVYYVYGNRKD